MRNYALYAKPTEEELKEAFLRAAVIDIRHIAGEQAYLTADDVWAYINKPSEPKLMGNAFQAAKAKGWIRPTQYTEISRQKTNHGRPVRVWKSTIYGG